MNRAIIIDLITRKYTTDSMGQKVYTETKNTVYATLSSISRQEWVSYASTGRQGLVPAYTVTTFFGNYNGESLVDIDGVRYGIYRTYERDDEQIELYLEKKAGNE